MIQGTASNVGKSLTVLALCRIFYEEGYSVTPFKPQNMSLNSIVTENDEEIAYIQYLQAKFCNAKIDSRINPILLKPIDDERMEVILRGRHFRDMKYEEYGDFLLRRGKEIIKNSYKELAKEYDLIISEGAGSPAEINLYKYDFANMRFAEMFNIPVIIVADIERGGAFASIYGTYMLLKRKHRKLVQGFIINKFRGNDKILYPGIKFIEKRLKKKIIGIIPYIDGLKIFEDSQDLFDDRYSRIGIVKYPTMSIYEDLISIGSYRFINNPEDIDFCDVIILPGSKNVPRDLEWMKRKGIFEKLREVFGKKLIIGICGGYQMMTKEINIYGNVYKGLGFINAVTKYRDEKIIRKVKAEFLLKNIEIECYEIRFGDIYQKGSFAFKTKYGFDGYIDIDRKIIATNLHGIFNNDEFKSFLEKTFGIKFKGYNIFNDLKRVVKIFREKIDMDYIEKVIKNYENKG